MANMKKYHITALSVFSCFGVVCMHTNNFWSFSKSLNWIAGNVVESFFYFAVPVFLMISGATLMDYRKRYTTIEYFKKRLFKTLIPFLFWSILGLFFNYYIYGKNSVNFDLFDIINSVINNKYMGVYYFFIILFSVYLSIPVFSLIPEERRRNGFLYIIAMAFVVNSFVPYILSFTGGKINHNGNFSFLVCSGYMIYPIIGYYLENYKISKKVKVAIFVFGFVGFATHFIGTMVLSWKVGEIVQVFKGYLSIFCILYSAAVFLLFKLFPFEKLPRFILCAIEFLGGQTFGIYLMHVFLITITTHKLEIDPQHPLGRLVFAFVMFVISGLITKLFQKVPLIKKLVP